jgi:multicomponent Na+:H+ antiporter subunit E
MRWLGRFAFMAVLWGVIAGPDPAGLAFGVLAAAGAAALSLRLMPPAPGRLRLAAGLRLAASFTRGSLLGGIDVARRAFDPRLPLHPGWIRHPMRLPPGPVRVWWGDLVSLMPGSLAAGDDERGLLVHCLDARQDVANELAAHEGRLRAFLGDDAAERPNG